ncbi:unnamed protein product [Didymodactylos carnosus]|uniref:Pasha n=1 Tax=Didymodactylos carnosus TaxID=1234261 RepID=A0A813WV03_9BILA|nr:unnamed protein product [Didymodactylos carnosus]CAF0863751.1 unnamed protein product [Didymodactylos carnosus]CAF3530583.1 unnamed protein product [Didymodactylos carnosus]CAF3651308.1 unnamed protein product [Didymodactylos carnosus]
MDDISDWSGAMPTDVEYLDDNFNVDDMLDEAYEKKIVNIDEEKMNTETTTSSEVETKVADSDINPPGQPKIYHRWTIKGYWHDKYNILPDGWVEVFHTSGLPLYFHKQSRVVSLSRPYFLGSTSVRHHLIPITAIPCLYLKKLQEEQFQSSTTTVTDLIDKSNTSSGTATSPLLQTKQNECPFHKKTPSTIKIENNHNITNNKRKKRKMSELEDGEISSPKPLDDVDEGEIKSPSTQEISSIVSSSPPQLPEETLLDESDNQENVNKTKDLPKTDSRTEEKQQQLPVSLQILSNSTLDETIRNSVLTADELRNYCEKRFQFEKREFKFFPSLGDKWRYIRQVQMKKREQQIPADAKVIELHTNNTLSTTTTANENTIATITTTTKTSLSNKPPLTMTNNNTKTVSSTVNNDTNQAKKVTIDLYPSKSPIALLQEYSFKVLKSNVKYDWFTTDVSKEPFGCRVVVGDVLYGTGIGRNKRTAKLHATEESLIILLPQYKKLIDQQQQHQQQDNSTTTVSTPTTKQQLQETSKQDEETTGEISTTVPQQQPKTFVDLGDNLLDEYRIEDFNIYDVCITLGKPTPYQMLEKSLTYNALTRGESQIKMSMSKKPMFTTITLEIGTDYKEQAQAKDKIHAKNLCAQKLLKKLHPHLQTYGSLIRLYEKNANTYRRVRVDDELAEIVRQAKKNEPNYALLAKLKEEMLKLKVKLEEKTKEKGGIDDRRKHENYSIHIVDVDDELIGRVDTKKYQPL